MSLGRLVLKLIDFAPKQDQLKHGEQLMHTHAFSARAREHFSAVKSKHWQKKQCVKLTSSLGA